MLLFQLGTGPLFHFPSPSASLCSWLVLAGVLAPAGQGWLALPSLWGASQESPQAGSVVFCSGQAFRHQTQGRKARGVHEPGQKEMQ